jgi:MFS family permease
MIVLDISITITALPKIHTTLGFSNTALSWVQNAYLLAFGGLLLLGTRASDLVAARRGTGQYEGVRLAIPTAGTHRSKEQAERLNLLRSQ